MSILRFLGLESKASTAADTQTVRRIVASLEAMDPQRARWIAAFAFLLCRVARSADGQCEGQGQEDPHGRELHRLPSLASSPQP